MLLRWSRRDRLAVLVVAVTVGFLTGATLVGVTLGAQTTAMAKDYGSDAGVHYYGSLSAAQANAGDGSVVLPVTRIRVDGVTDGTGATDGPPTSVIGVPSPPPSVSMGGQRVAFPTPRRDVLLLPGAGDARERTVVGPGGSRTLRVAPRTGGAVVPASWAVAPPETVADLGPTGAYVLTTRGRSQTPLVSALWFFVLGTRQLIELLGLATAASGVLVLVTVYSVTQITVQERRRTIGVIRSTGGSPYGVLALFGLRALLVAAVGAATGYAVGVILVRLVLNAAVYLGLSTSLDVRLTGRALSMLAPAVVALVGVGGVAGVVAALPVVRCPPARVTRPNAVGPSAPTSGPRDDGRQPGGGVRRLGGAVGRRVRGVFDTRLLEWDALVPATATLSVFVAFLLLAAAVGGVLGPLASADQQTITQPGAPHPFASSVPQVYADALREQGIRASPEILLLEARGDTPYLARGVNFSAYRSLSHVEVVDGRAPRSPDEAVVGVDLAQSLSVGVGDSLTLGGFTHPTFERVRIVGTFAGTGSQDDQVLVSLPVARSLQGKRPGMVQFVRTGRVPSASAGATVAVVDARTSRTKNATRVVLVLQNYGLSDGEASLDVRLAGHERTITETVPAGRQTKAQVTFPRLSTGTYRLSAGSFETNVTLGGSGGSGGGLQVTAPDRVPTGAAPAVAVTASGKPAAGANVTVTSPDGGERTFETGDGGRVHVPFPAPGAYSLTAASDGDRATASVDVGDGYRRTFAADLGVTPASPTVVTRPRATARLSNPWKATVTRRVALVGPGTRTVRTVTLPPDGSTTIRADVERRPSGSYRVALLQDGTETASTEYAVQGDRRLAAALASSGRRSSGGGIARAASVAFGNIQVLLVSLIALTATMTIGGTTASFTRSIRGKREEIGIRRATGATPRDVYRLVLGDALRVGGVASVIALAVSAGALTGLLTLGQLRVFGITLRPALSPTLLAGAGGAALALALLSAIAAAAALVRRPPASLLSSAARREVPPRTGDGSSARGSPTSDGGIDRE
ncbi:MAG: FtsX-like permease family protein [Salinigranum sp.]